MASKKTQINKDSDLMGGLCRTTPSRIKSGSLAEVFNTKGRPNQHHAYLQLYPTFAVRLSTAIGL
jgi:hypothetical protein